jgi:ankyrin repeat protein
VFQDVPVAHTGEQHGLGGAPAVDEEGKTALQLALDNDKRKVAKVLCKHGAQGALCYAAKNDLRGMVEELISKKHDLKECDKDGKTALDLAAEANDGEGHSKVVGLLIKAGLEAGQWQDVNACLGSVISVYVCTCAWVYVGSEGGM